MSDPLNQLNQPPQIMYPQSGGVFLMAEVQRLTANVADLIDLLVRRDQTIAQLTAELNALKAPAASNVVQITEPAA